MGFRTYQTTFKLFKIRHIIKNNVNSPVLVITFSPKAFGCLRLFIQYIFSSILRTFTIYFNMKLALCVRIEF